MCVRCGGMVNDSVREELASSITPIALSSKPKSFVPANLRDDEPTAKPTIMTEPTPAPAPKRVQTASLPPKKTSPTLAEFKTPKAVIPDWRIELQNKIRQRTGRVAAEPIATNAVSPAARPSRGGAALKVQYEPEAENAVDLKVANALKRIEQSRRTYLPTEKAREGIRVARAAAASRNYPFNVVARSADLPEKAAAAPKSEPAATAVRPRLVSSMKIEKKSYDTNKLTPIPEAENMSGTASKPEETPEIKPALRNNWSQKIEFRGSTTAGETIDGPIVDEVTETDDLDDLAPLSLRFNAGLFDLIIGGFASFILFSPFIGLYDGWASASGLLVFASILMAVMFVYLTASIAYFGQTFGMKLFSLELVDAEQSEFPTLHQAAVNSSVYLLSLVFGGLGFLSVFFNEEKRAAHDIVSGTILVREI